MFISDSLSKLFNSYSNEKTSTSDIKTNSSSLKDIHVNDEVKVSVVSVNKDSIDVRMPNGSEISIAGNMPEGIKEGDILNIRILGKTEGKPLIAEIISQEKNLEAKVEDLKLILKDLGIAQSKENLNTINDMANAGIEVNKENINKIFNIIEGMNIPKENAIFMVKNDIEVTSESSRAFNNMITKSDFLETNLKVLIDQLTSAINEIDESIETNVLSSDVSNINIAKSIELGSMVNQALTDEFANASNLVNGENIAGNNAQMVTTENENPQVLINTNMATNENGEITANPAVMVSNKIETAENTINNTTDGQLSTGIIDKTVDNSNVNAKNLENINVLETPNAVDSTINGENEVLTNKNVDNNVINQYSDFEFGVMEEVETNDASNKQVTLTKEEIIQKPNEGTTLNEEETLSLSKIDDEISKILNDKDASKKDKLIALRKEVIGIFREVKGSKNLSEEISLKRIFKSFKDVINDVENNKELFTKETAESLLKETSHMKENLELISDLNKYNTVVHIPLQINDNKSIAELYIFNGDKNSSKRKINENNATMFLSLGTANMGQVESYIKVVNKTIECNFMTENDLGTKFIIENKDHLSELLGAYGYTLVKASAETYTGKTLNIFDAIEKNKKDEKQKGFDALA